MGRERGRPATPERPIRGDRASAAERISGSEAAAPLIDSVPAPIDVDMERVATIEPVAEHDVAEAENVEAAASAVVEPPRAAAARPGPPPRGAARPEAMRPNGAEAHAASDGDDTSGERGATAPQLRRFIKSRAYVPMHELRRRFAINGGDDEVTQVELDRQRVYVGLPEREGRLLGELLRGGDIGYELSLDPISPIVVGVYPMRPVTRA